MGLLYLAGIEPAATYRKSLALVGFTHHVLDVIKDQNFRERVTVHAADSTNAAAIIFWFLLAACRLELATNSHPDI